MYWTICSKNSADGTSSFVEDGHRLFAPLITPELLTVLVDQNIHLCAEIITLNDQTHGAKVLKESPVVTIIGQRCDDHSKFVHFFDHEEVVQFCVKHNLPCDSVWRIESKQVCSEFLKKLDAERDFLTNSTFDKLVETFGPRSITGSVTHADILGEPLEGLVVKLATSDATFYRK